MAYPVIVGGNGHSGTRIFAEVLDEAGVHMGIPGLTRAKPSYDLNVRRLLNRWCGPYLRQELTPSQRRAMEREFRFALRVYFPWRGRPWGFKNPRSMFLLPFYDQIFPDMRFVHVIRDGRDVTLGNKLAGNPEYISAFLGNDMPGQTAEERMIEFWGRSNAKAQDYGTRSMPGRYLLMRFEDLCERPMENATRLLEFAGADAAQAVKLVQLIQKPKSVGRWAQYSDAVISRIQEGGQPWLNRYGYG